MECVIGRLESLTGTIHQIPADAWSYYNYTPGPSITSNTDLDSCRIEYLKLGICLTMEYWAERVVLAA